jgi:hypothetical protein
VKDDDIKDDLPTCLIRDKINSHTHTHTHTNTEAKGTPTRNFKQNVNIHSEPPSAKKKIQAYW